MRGGAARLLAAALLAAAAAPAPASPAPEDGERARLARLCEAAGARAARAAGVPERLMRAIALAETGRPEGGRLRPWPWTVNMEGEGRWFDAPGPLLDWVRARQGAGARSFDLGCFQVNHHWHGDAFAGLEAMLDPEANAAYAARFLAALHAEAGDWETAVGWYHSRTPELARRYRARVLRLAEGLGPAPDPGPAPAPGAFAAGRTAVPGAPPAAAAGAAPAGGVPLALLAAPRAGGAPQRAGRPLLLRPAGGGLLTPARPAPLPSAAEPSG